LGEVEIIPVRDRRKLRQFIAFPYFLYRNDPHWVPPLIIAQRALLDTRKHPFYAHAEMECFLARRDNTTVGRVAAILDRKFNEVYDERIGFFGFLESIDAPPVAQALLHTARKWLLERGVRVMRGPVNPSMNYECGVLVDGFDSSPRVMMSYNPRYYGALIESAGLRKAKDLYAFESSPTRVAGQKTERIADRALRSNRVAIRTLRMKNFDSEVELIWSIYNSAWSRNWGFVPMTREEFFVMAKDMKPVLVPDFALIGEIGGRAVGFALALPDINQALKPARGRLFPFGLIKILYRQRKIRDLRVLALGVLEEFRTAGVAAGFYATLIRQARRLGYRECEFSWVLEDNILMNRSIQALGAKRYKTYRIYEWS
jgi:GNAT superfamily N-acetyltransferase